MLSILAFVALAAPLSQMDKDYLVKMAEADIAEVKICSLAPHHTKNSDILGACRMMISSHNAHLETVKKLANRYRVTLPTRQNATHERIHAAISRLHGDQFDASITRAQLSEHAANINLARQEARRGQEGAIRDQARRDMDALGLHRNHWKDIGVRNGKKWPMPGRIKGGVGHGG